MLVIKELLDTAFRIRWTSGTRCLKHNQGIGGSPTSGHVPAFGDNGDESVALDGVPEDPSRMRQIAVAAIKAGAKGFGIYDDGHFHLDDKPRIAWWRKWGGSYDYFF
jgi:hypothetical protein